MAESRGVAAIAARNLHPPQKVDSLLGKYTADVLTDRILRITVSAPSEPEAVSRANAVASAFLAFRNNELHVQQKLQFVALDGALAQGQNRIKSLSRQISRMTPEPQTKPARAHLLALQAARDQANNEFVVLKNEVESTKATAEATTAAMVGQSKVLDAASPLPHSRSKTLILFGGAGLIFGLLLGVGIVVVRALTSDRVRRRDDVALALRAPIRLSIPANALRHRGPRRRGLGALHDRDVQRIVAVLGGTLSPEAPSGALAVVPVDDSEIAALSILAFGASLAQQGAKVLVADLCVGAPVGRLMGQKQAGVHLLNLDGAEIHLVIPDPDQIAPLGPLSATTQHGQLTATRQTAIDYPPADNILSLVTLEPSVPSDHLRTWAMDAVVMVTSGRSSWSKLHAAGELIRLAGVRLAYAVLLGSDKSDESLGLDVPQDGAREFLNPAGNTSSESRTSNGSAVPRFIGR